VTPVHLVIPSRNSERWARRCLQSACTQDYPELRITWIDDASDAEEAFAIAGMFPVLRVQNDQRVGGLRNVVKHARFSKGPDEIVCVLGGDDYLPHARCVSELVEAMGDGWVCYSDAEDPLGRPAPDNSRYELEEFRDQGFRMIGLVGFRAALARKIRDEDLKIGGWWQPSAGDNALYMPMLEMSGLDRLRYSARSLYVYDRHPEDTDASCAPLQGLCEYYSRFCRPRYHRLDNLEDEARVSDVPWGIEGHPGELTPALVVTPYGCRTAMAKVRVGK
jgi:glycosyltransferase involved in cell wall biosynthesis